MQYTKLGNSGIEVSKLCLGCMSFGDPASKMHAWTLNPEESEKRKDLVLSKMREQNFISEEEFTKYSGEKI